MGELEPGEIDETLTRNGVGTLALVDGDQPYAVPMSFGYDGRKERCVDSNPNAGFTVYEHTSESAGTWRSVVITGELYEVAGPDKERALASLAANGRFAPDLGVWGVPFGEVNLRLFGIRPEDYTGRGFSMEVAE